MKIGVGGSVGGLRAGVSNRGVGGGVGPVSAGKSFRRHNGGNGGDGFKASDLIGLWIPIVLGIFAVLIAGPLVLAYVAYRCYRSGRKVLSGLCLVAAVVAGWASFTYVLYPSYAQLRYEKDIPGFYQDSPGKAKAKLHDAGFQHVVIDPPHGETRGDCDASGTKPEGKADYRKTVHVVVECWGPPSS